MQAAILLDDGVTALDAIGPYEVLQSPGLDIDVRFVAREKGLKRTDFGRLGLMADYTREETPRPDILLVAGTAYPQAVMGDQQVLEWIAQVHKTTKWTTSARTGAVGLGAAGVSSGIDMARTLVVEEFGAATAQTAQLRIEYDPQPPFDAGSPDKASPLVVSAAHESFATLSQKPRV
jgi:putative intracellular protease/amidase